MYDASEATTLFSMFKFLNGLKMISSVGTNNIMEHLSSRIYLRTHRVLLIYFISVLLLPPLLMKSSSISNRVSQTIPSDKLNIYYVFAKLKIYHLLFFFTLMMLSTLSPSRPYARHMPHMNLVNGRTH